MNNQLLDILICPSCKSKLKLFPLETGESCDGNIVDNGHGKGVMVGLLKCNCGLLYPIIEGVPRFLEGGIYRHADFVKKYREQIQMVCSDHDFEGVLVESDPIDDHENIRKSFSQEWELFNYDNDKTWGWTLDERKAIFLDDMGLKKQELGGKRLLDAGCGNGTLTAILSEFDIDVVGLDLNDGLGRAYANRTKFSEKADNAVQYVQGNLVIPPLAEETFDLVYSSGVIHHTPSSKGTFDSLVPLTKKGGRLYVWVYGKRAFPVRMFFAGGRYLKKFVTLRTLAWTCRAMAPFYRKAAEILNWSGIMKFRSRTTQEVTLDLFDAMAPRFNHWHTESEVYQWFQEHGFRNITVSGRQKHGFGMYGDRY